MKEKKKEKQREREREREHDLDFLSFQRFMIDPVIFREF